MTLERFNELLHVDGRNGIQIVKDLFIFNDYELYNAKTDRSKQYNSLDELVNNNPDVAKIIDEAEDFYLDWSGGRGSSSSGATMGGGFDHAKGGGGRGGENEEVKKVYPAELNLGNKNGTSVEHVLNKFIDKYKDADREYGITVDENGYATQHKAGDLHSVAISGRKGETLIHNHPSGSNFSDNDLINFANEPMKSIVATSSNAKTKGTYQITKNNNFDAKGFSKAVKKAKWDTSKYSYNTGADWWLKKNQKKYGYTYTSKGVSGAGKGENGW